MKEAALSAAALMGLMGFAAYYNHQDGGARVKRQTVDIEVFDQPESQNDVDPFELWEEEALKEFLLELDNNGDQKVTGDDVIQKAPKVNFRRLDRRKFGNADWNAAFKSAHKRRYNSLAQFVDFNEFAYPQSQAAIGTEDAPGISTSVYDGFDTTHPKIAAVLAEDTVASTVQSRTHFAEGNTILAFVFPATVPLTSDVGENLPDFAKMWNLATNFKPLMDAYRGRSTSQLTPRLIFGKSTNKVSWQSRSPARYDRRRFPWSRYQNYNNRPAMSAMQPYLVRTALDIRNMIEPHAATPSADKDCFTVWFHQEIGADLNQLLLPETQELLGDINRLCTIMNVFVGYDSYDPVVQRYAAALNPGLQMKAPLDNDFSGIWIVKKHAEVETPEFAESMWKYMAIVKARAGCRCSDNVYSAPVTESPPTGVAGDLTGAPTDAPTDASLLTTAIDDGFDRELTVAPTLGGVLEAFTAEARVSVLDSCCGADFFQSVAYDSELKTCCETGVVRSWNADGSDPCPLF